MQLVETKNKRIGLTATIVLHVVLVILFIFFGMTHMNPPPEEEGITINFGTSEMGMGDVQPEEVASTSTPQETIDNTPEETPTEASADQDILTTTEDAPAVETKKKKEEPKEVKEPVKEEPKPDKNLTDALSNWKNNKNTNSGEGDTQQAGDQGSTDGDLNSTNRAGGGQGNGVSFNLSGRSMLAAPRIKDDSQEEGKVVVDIIVDNTGKVVRATPGARGSTTASSILYEKAQKAAYATKFNANPNAAQEQKGQMTFIFILN
jgi:outer membrane biosynthesis protein TonB